jgi:hypothetical protein
MHQFFSSALAAMTSRGMVMRHGTMLGGAEAMAVLRHSRQVVRQTCRPASPRSRPTIEAGPAWIASKPPRGGVCGWFPRSRPLRGRPWSSRWSDLGYPDTHRRQEPLPATSASTRGTRCRPGGADHAVRSRCPGDAHPRYDGSLTAGMTGTGGDASVAFQSAATRSVVLQAIALRAAPFAKSTIPGTQR